MKAVIAAASVFGCLRFANGAVTGAENVFYRRNEPVKMPAWNYANATTPDATPNGFEGVIFEPDLIDGATGKDGGKVRKMRIGPYKLTPGETKTGLVPPFGLPCTDCYITAMQLTCEYAGGKSANVDTGAWCHHMDLTINPSKDYTCPSDLWKAITTLADPAMGGERVFSGGNERTAIRLNSKQKYGLDLGNWKWFSGVFELMSESTKPIEMYMAMTFEYVPKSTPGYKPASMVWLDVTDCARESEYPAELGVYKKESHDFEMKHDADWVAAVGHVHDGGTKVEMYVNGKLVCNSKQVYANRRGGFVEPAHGGDVRHDMVMPEGSHISDVGACKDFLTTKKGDKIKIIAYYDDKAHPQMRNPKGKLEGQMGIMFSYIGYR